jgi:CRP/FNR family transcriptional regulator
MSTARPFTLASPLQLRPDLRRFWDGTIPVTFRRGEYLYLPASLARNVFLVRSGAVRLAQMGGSGGELTVDVAGPAELVGESAVLGQPRRQGLAQALDRVKASPLPTSILDSALQSNPDLALALARITAERSRRFQARAVLTAFADCRRRLIALLLEMAERFGEDDERGRRIGIRLTHEELGRMIGAARETVTPLLIGLRREGAIDYDRRGLWLQEGLVSA